MITATWNHKMHRAIRLGILIALSCVVVWQIGNAQGDNMKTDDFQISIDAQPVLFAEPPVLKDGIWLVPLEHFAKQLGLKVEYLADEKIVVLCGGTESELCVPLRFQNGKSGVIDIDGVTYARPTSVAEPFGFELYKTSPNAIEVIQPEHLAPEFTLPDLQDTARHLRDFRGKKTLLYVWGSW